MQIGGIGIRCATALVLATGLLLGCRTVDVAADWDPAVDFARLATWQFADEPMKPAGDPVLDGDGLFSQRVQRAVAQQLEAKGYRPAPDGEAPDFRVAYFLVVEDEVSVTTLNDYHGYGPGWGWRYGYSAGWGYGPGGLGTQTYVDQYKRGTLVIDVSTGPTNELVWRGTGSARLREPKSPEDAEARINQAVRDIMARFPPPAAGSD